MKSKLVIITSVILVVVASLLIAGCATNTTNTASKTPSASAATSVSTTNTITNQIPSANATNSNTTHDALLEKLAALEYNHSKSNLTISSWDVQWVNGTTVHIQASGSGQNSTFDVNETYMRFPSNDAAAAYLQTYNRSGYTYNSLNATTDTLYYEATGRLPSTYQGYVNLLNPRGLPDQVVQMDDVIQIIDMTTKLQ